VNARIAGFSYLKLRFPNTFEADLICPLFFISEINTLKKYHYRAKVGGGGAPIEQKTSQNILES